MSKTLGEMTIEVSEFCHDKGWSGPGSPAKTFGDCMSLLHSEVSEAVEAFRDYGLDNVSAIVLETTPCHNPECFGNKNDAHSHHLKPIGVPSEFADILIRLLDDCDRYGVDLEAAVAGSPPVVVDKEETFGTHMARLHVDIATATDDHFWRTDLGAEPNSKNRFARIYRHLKALAENYGIDLEAEYEEKMYYNRSRAIRHGGKRL